MRWQLLCLLVVAALFALGGTFECSGSTGGGAGGGHVFTTQP